MGCSHLFDASPLYCQELIFLLYYNINLTFYQISASWYQLSSISHLYTLVCVTCVNIIAIYSVITAWEQKNTQFEEKSHTEANMWLLWFCKPMAPYFLRWCPLSRCQAGDCWHMNKCRWVDWRWGVHCGRYRALQLKFGA